MATFEKHKPSPGVPADLLPVIKTSGVLSDRALAEIRAKVLAGDYPHDPAALADKLVTEGVLTDYQAKRFLTNKPHGLVVGRYVIVDRLGSGSMGRVYKARHVLMDRHVALKIIAPEIVSNERVVARFQREMRLVGRLDHPNVIRAFDADQVNKVFYIVMEYVKGEPLNAVARRALIAPLDMADFAAQAALGLAHAHAQGIVHRDVKPSNLLLTDDRQVKVLDLGLGALMEADNSSSFATADGVAVGTIDYMSPEQACGRDVDGRSDLYSLGCTMYSLMTGVLPFPGDSPIERMGMRISGRPVPITDVRPDVPKELVRVLDKLMAHKPQDRYQTAAEAAEALQGVARPKPRAARGASEAAAAPAPAAKPPAPERVVVKVKPNFPGWFRPLAASAESRPGWLLTGAVTGALGLLGVGVVLGHFFW